MSRAASTGCRRLHGSRTCRARRERAWAEAIAFTREKSPASFDQWFSGVQFDGLTDGVLSLRARDEFVRQWVEDYFLPTLTEQLRDAHAAQHPGALGDRRSASTARRRSACSVRAGPSAPALRASAAAGRSTSRSATASRASTRSCPRRRVAVAVAPPIEGLNAKYTFANFVVGPSNQLAHAASMAAAGVGGRRHNPLFICGGTGLGKTHLVHAIAHRVREERPGARIVYISAERFVNEFVQALQDQQMHEFRARYREKCDLLLVDDIHFLAGQDADAGGVLPRVQRAPPGEQADRRHERQVPAAARQDGGAARVALPVGARRGHPGAGARDARRDRPQEGAARAHRPGRRSVPLHRADGPQQRARARGDAHPPRGEGVAPRQADRPLLRADRDRRDDDGAPERGERRGHPARRLPPLQAPLDGPPLEGPPQEHRLRASRGDVPVQAAPQVQLPGARARVRQPRSHDGHQRASARSRPSAPAIPRCARTSRPSSASSAPEYASRASAAALRSSPARSSPRRPARPAARRPSPRAPCGWRPLARSPSPRARRCAPSPSPRWPSRPGRAGAGAGRASGRRSRPRVACISPSGLQHASSASTAAAASPCDTACAGGSFFCLLRPASRSRCRPSRARR